jgi:RecA/RadA recombinase
MLIKDSKKNKNKEVEVLEEPEDKKKKFKSQLGKLLASHETEHFNFHHHESYLVSSGSLLLDAALGGGFPPGIHRFGGASEGGKTSEAMEVLNNFLKTVPNSKAMIVKAEGRLAKKMKLRSGMKFVDNPDDWVPGTCFVLKSNVYEVVASIIDDLIQVNPENFKYAILIDSLDGLNLREDLTKPFDGDSNARVCGTPTITKRLFKKLSLPISELSHMIIAICQIVVNIPAKFDPKEQLVVGGGGGNAAIHFANFILKFLPHYKGDMITSDGAAVNFDFGQSNAAGHWAIVKLEKTDNEKTNNRVRYPIKYDSDDEVGRIWTELEIKQFAIFERYIIKDKAWYHFTNFLIERMKAGGIQDPPEKLYGENKVDTFLAREDVIEVFRKIVREINPVEKNEIEGEQELM